jgi:hypothetical protein
MIMWAIQIFLAVAFGAAGCSGMFSTGSAGTGSCRAWGDPMAASASPMASAA